MSMIILETERLSLRKITADDLDDLLEIWGDHEAMRLFLNTLDRQSMRERRMAERNGLRIEKEVSWRGYNRYVYVIEREYKEILAEELAEDSKSNVGVTSAEDAATG